MMPQEPEALQKILHQIEDAVRRAFAEGYRLGASDAADRMMRAATYSVDTRLPAILGTNAAPAVTTTGNPRAQERMSPPKVGLKDAPRQYRYGAVISTVRQALLSAADTGMTRDEILDFCHQRGVDVTQNTLKDVFKRLKWNEELIIHDTIAYPGPKLEGQKPAYETHGLFKEAQE